ncbi:MAG: hypothetical protein ABIY50_12075 [Ignavibacteria bacterium]
MKNIILIFLFINFFSSLTMSQWVTQQSGTTAALRDIQYVGNNILWACGEGGTIIRTTNNGVNWYLQTTNVPSKPLFGIHAVNQNVAYSVGWFATILKTTNGGVNWIIIENGTAGQDGNYFSVFFINEMTGWIGENNIMGSGDVKKTTDGGKTFVTSVTSGWPRDLYFKDSLNGIGVDGGATIHKTTNGGENWLSFSLAGTGDFYKVSFINNFTGFTVAAGSNKVYKTTDFGSNWFEISVLSDVQEFVRCIKFSSDSIGFIGGNFSRLYKTTNQGVNWRREQISTGFILDITSLNDSVFLDMRYGR